MQFSAIVSGQAKNFEFCGKANLFKQIINLFFLSVEVHRNESLEMMREIERLFESLKEDFNEKISNISYFTNYNDSNENPLPNSEGSASDSFEDISLPSDMIPDNKSPTTGSEKRSIRSASTDNSKCDFDQDMLKNEVSVSLDNFLNNDDGNFAFEDTEEFKTVSDKNSDKEKSNSIHSVGEDYTLDKRKESGSLIENYDSNKTENVKVNDDKNIIVCEGKENAERDLRSHRSSSRATTNEEVHSLLEFDDVVTKSDENKKQISEDEEEDVFQGYDDTSDVDMINEAKSKNKLNVKEKKNSSKLYIDELNKEAIKTPERESPISKKSVSEKIIKKELENKSFENVKLRKTVDGKSSSTNHYVTNKRMWSEMPEVIESNALKSISKKEIQLQEAMFEIITSEMSYYQSLMTLTTHFFLSDLFKTSENKENLVSQIDKHHIFSNVILIMTTSQNLLRDLEQRWHDEKPILSDVCDIVLDHAINEDFKHYVTYLSNQEYQTQALKRLSENESFKQQLTKLESSPTCGKLSLDSYLMLPMQRLTRLKLLVEAVSKLQNCDELSPKISQSIKSNAINALEEIKKLLNTSNTKKGIMDQKEALLSIINRLEFPMNVKRISLSDRVLILEEELTVHPQTSLKILRKITKKKQLMLTLVLFNNLLIITKRKLSKLLVYDYCDRNSVKAQPMNFTRNESDNSVSTSTSTLDINSESQMFQKSFGSSLIRSKTSLTGDERKRLSIPLGSTFTSMPSINKGDGQDIKNRSFSLTLLETRSEIFTEPIYLTASNKMDRDMWLFLFNNNNSESEPVSPLKSESSFDPDFIYFK